MAHVREIHLCNELRKDRLSSQTDISSRIYKVRINNRSRERERRGERKLRWDAHQISWACNPYVDYERPFVIFRRPCDFTRGFRRNTHLLVRPSSAGTRKACYMRRRFSIFPRDDSIDIPRTMSVIRFHASLMTRQAKWRHSPLP